MPRAARRSNDLEGRDDLLVGQVVEEQAARDVVERAVANGGVRRRRRPGVDVRRPAASRVVECAREYVRGGNPQVETVRASPGDQRAGHVGGAAGDLEHLDALTRTPRAAERLEPSDRRVTPPKSRLIAAR